MMSSLASSLEPAATWVFFSSVKSIAVIALVLAFRRWLTPWLSPEARHRLWFAVLVCLLIPLGVQIESFPSLASTAQETITSAQPIEARHRPTLEQPLNAIALREDEGDSFSKPLSDFGSTLSSSSRQPVWPSHLLVLLWMGVAAVLAAITFWNLIAYFRIKSAATAVNSSMDKIFARCKEQLDLRREVRLLESTGVDSPAIYGWWSPTLLLPAGIAAQLTKDQLRHVFLHELAHVQRHDILINWFAAVAQVIHWFNPLVWYGFRAMRNDMEPACDARVMNCLSTAEQRDYGNTLIKMTDFYPQRRLRIPGLAQGAGVADGDSQLKRRIQMIAQFRPARLKHSLLAALLFTAVTSVALTQPKDDSDLEKMDVASVDEPAAKPAVRIAATAPFDRIAAATPAARIELPPAKRSATPPKIVIAQAPPREADAATGIKTEAPKTESAEGAKPATKATQLKYGVPIEDLIAQVAEKTRKKFIVDPRVRGQVQVIGQNLNQIDYPGLLTILRVHNFAGVEVNGYVNVVPISEARNLAVPKAAEGKDYPDDQWMSMTIHAKNACAANLLPVLRPLVPQYAHMAVEASGNSLLIIDTFANLKKIEAIVKDLDARSTSNGQWANGQCGTKADK